ncbi:hypothetical protein L9F63_018035, partial [Diploptera punctata]
TFIFHLPFSTECNLLNYYVVQILIIIYIQRSLPMELTNNFIQAQYDTILSLRLLF